MGGVHVFHIDVVGSRRLGRGHVDGFGGVAVVVVLVVSEGRDRSSWRQYRRINYLR